MRRVSKKRARQRRLLLTIRGRVFERDGGCIARDHDELGRCFGPPTPHHLLKAAQGGEYTEDNLVTLCAGHNAAVEDHPDIAHRLGLVVKSWEAARRLAE